MRRKIMAGVAAAAVVVGGTMAVTESPAEAHVGCKLIHVEIGTLLHFCLI